MTRKKKAAPGTSWPASHKGRAMRPHDSGQHRRKPLTGEQPAPISLAIFAAIRTSLNSCLHSLWEHIKGCQRNGAPR